MRYLLLLIVIAALAEEDDISELTTAERDALTTAEYLDRIGYTEINGTDDPPPLTNSEDAVRLNLTTEEEEEVEKLRVPLERGMDTVRRAFIGVCWWVWVKKTHNDRPGNKYGRCRSEADYMMDDIVALNHLHYVIGLYVMSKDQEQWTFIEKSFGKQCLNRIIAPPCYTALPEEVQKNCTEYLSYPRDKYEVDESEALGVEKGADYPYLGFAHCLIHTLRLTHGDRAVEVVKRDMPLFRAQNLYGRVYWHKNNKEHVMPYMIKLLSKPSELLIRAHIMVCWYEYLIASYKPHHYKDCKIKQKEIQRKLLLESASNGPLSVRPELFNEDIASHTRGAVIHLLPKVYRDECEKYLMEHPLDDPPADESAVLGVDSEARFHFRSYDFCLLHTIRKTRGDEAISIIKDKMPEVNRPIHPHIFKTSLAKVAQAQYLVCWYEFARREDRIGYLNYQQCKGRRSLYDFKEWNTKMYHQNQEMWEFMFGYELLQHNLQNLQSYRKACERYLSFYTEHFPASESDLLEDEKVEYSLKSYAHCILHHMKETHGDNAMQIVKKQLSRLHNPDEYLETLMGVKMVTAVNTAIGYLDLSKSEADILKRKSERVEDKFLEFQDDKDFPEYSEVEFAMGIRNEIYKIMPQAYHDCKMYLTWPEEVFQEDESGILGEEGIDYQFKSYCHCMIHKLRKTKGDGAIDKLKQQSDPRFRSVLFNTFAKNNANDVDTSGTTNEDIESEILKLERGHKLACWYEFAKSLFAADQDTYHACNDAPPKLKKDYMESKYMHKFEEMKAVFFGKFIKTTLLRTLPTWYSEKCGSLLNSPNTKPLSDETDILNDGGSDYTYKAYAHCIIRTLREKHGDQAIEDVKMKATQPSQDWRQIIYERFNKARNWKNTRPALTLSEELNEGAQKHADELASKCVLEKSNPDARKSKDGPQGESVAWNSFEPEDAVLFAISEIWEEGKLFDPNIRYTSQEDEWTQGGIGRYGQMMWKKTTHVGFGLAVNRTCESDPIKNPGTYVVIRYFPLGNKRNRYWFVQVPSFIWEYD